MSGNDRYWNGRPTIQGFVPTTFPKKLRRPLGFFDDRPVDILLFTEVTLAVVRKQIADEEYVNAAAQNPQHSIESSASDFILAGMDIEERQYVQSFYTYS